MNLLKRCIAEFIGTAVLVCFACGVAVYTNVNIVATSLAFGLVIVAMAYSIGNVSGCHINPAVSIAMLVSKKMSVKEFLFYILAQFLGAIFGAFLLGFFFGGFEALGANQVQVLVTKVYDSKLVQYLVAFVVEVVLTFVFVIAILGVTSKSENKAVTGIVIGLTLTLVHLLGLAFTGTSVNPARSFGPALLQAFAGETEALKQLWIFILAPLVGGVLAAITYACLTKETVEE